MGGQSEAAFHVAEMYQQEVSRAGRGAKGGGERRREKEEDIAMILSIIIMII